MVKQQKSKKNKDAGLDDIPEGGLNDFMKVLGPVLKKYTRFRLYKLFKLIPSYIRYGFWSSIGLLVWKIPPTQKIIENGIKSLQLIFPKKSFKEIETISKNQWRLLGFGFFSSLMVEFPNYTEKNIDKYVRFEGLEHLDAALKRGKGVIMASTHVGPLPAMYIGLALKGYKANVIANVRVSGPLITLRPIPGIRCIPTGSLSGENSIRDKLHYVLKQNELLYMFCDFSQRKQMGIKFLGKLGHTPAGLPVLAQETGAPILPICVYYRTFDRAVVKIFPEIKMVEKPTKKEFLGYNMLRLNNMMTWLIRRFPVQYFEATSYEMLKLYQKKFEVENVDSIGLGLSLVDFCRDLVNTTYEAERNDELYLNKLYIIENQIQNISPNEISQRKFSFKYAIIGSHIKDEILKLGQQVLKLGVDKPLRAIIKQAMQELVISKV